MRRLTSGGDEVIGESSIVNNIGLWSDNEALKFVTSLIWLSNLTNAMSSTSEWYPEMLF